MPAFKDASDREWVVRLDAPTIADVRKEIGIDLAEGEGKVAHQLAEDPVLLVNTLWVICRDQARETGVTDRQFGKSLVGDPIGAAATALVDAIADFFPSSKRTLLRSLVEKQGAVREAGTKLALAKVNSPELEKQLLAAMEAKMDDEIKSMLTRLSSATDSPASSA